MSFGQRLTNLRVARGLTQAELAKRSGVSPSYLGQLEAGRYQPTLEVVRNLAVTLAVSIDQLAFDDHERHSAHHDDDLAVLLDAVSVLDQHDRDSVRNHIEALLYRHQAQNQRATRQKPGPPRRR